MGIWYNLPMKKCYLSLVALAAAATVGAATYKNPVLVMDFSDPDVCVGHDGKFYMTASSFGGLPGLPILVSDDLVNWQYAAYALREHPFGRRRFAAARWFAMKGRRVADAGPGLSASTSSTGAIRIGEYTVFRRRIQRARGANRAWLWRGRALSIRARSMTTTGVSIL